MELSERLLSTLNQDGLMEIGLLRQIISQNTELAPFWKEFETALMSKLNLHNKELKQRLEEFVFHQDKTKVYRDMVIQYLMNHS